MYPKGYSADVDNLLASTEEALERIAASQAENDHNLALALDPVGFCVRERGGQKEAQQEEAEEAVEADEAQCGIG